MKLLSRIALSIFLGSTAIARAQGINFGTIAYGGNGCPSGSDMGIILGTNSLSLGPQNFQIVVDDSGQKIQRSSCNISLSLRVPSGQKLIIDSQKQEGGHYQSAHSQLSIHQEIFFAGGIGPKILFRSVPTIDKGDFYSHTSDFKIASDCGAGAILRINSSITGVITGPEQFIYADKDKIELKFHLESCH